METAQNGIDGIPLFKPCQTLNRKMCVFPISSLADLSNSSMWKTVSEGFSNEARRTIVRVQDPA